MNKDIHTLYKNEEIDFILNKGLKFFLITRKSSSRYSGDSNSIQIQKHISDVVTKDNSFSASSYDLTPTVIDLSDKKEIFEHIRYGYNKPELSEEFFYLFYNKYPKYHKELLKESYYYFCVDIKKNLNTFISNTSKNYKEAEKNLLDYPISVLTATTLDLNVLNKKLKSLGGNDEQLFNFWLSFFKARKNQIQTPKVSPIVADFLSSQFEYEQLEKFFPFFTYLQAKYEDIEPDIFDGEHKYATSVFVNLKKMSKVFGLDNWSYDQFESGLKVFMVAIKKYYKLEEALFADISRAKKLFNMGFFHNNENFNRDLLKSRIVQLFNSFKLNNKESKDLTDEFLQSWLAQQELQDSLAHKTEHKAKKMKI